MPNWTASEWGVNTSKLVADIFSGYSLGSLNLGKKSLAILRNLMLINLLNGHLLRSNL